MLRLPTPRALRAAVTVAVTGAALVVPVALAAPAQAATAPSVTSVTPTSGSVNGGTAVTVTGKSFTGATAVRFGTTPAAAFRVVSATTITATAPAGNLGPVDIRVTTPSGVSAVKLADRHTYVGGYRLTGTTAVGPGPAGVGVDTSTNTAYVSNSGDDTVSVVDLATNRVLDEIYVPPVGGGSGRSTSAAAQAGLGRIAVDTANHLVYVLDTAGERVVVLDGTTRTVVRTVDVPTPIWVTVDQTRHIAYAVSNVDGSVTSIDSAGATDVGNAGGEGAAAMAVDPTTRTGYITNTGDGNVAVVDLTTLSLVTTVPVGRVPFGVAVDPATHTVYVSNSADDTISVLEGTRVTATFAVVGADRLELDASARTLYVASEEGTVRVVDPVKRVVTATVTVPSGISALAIDPARHALAVAVAGDSADTVSVIQAGNPPLVSGISPTTGSVSGGRTVTITGTGFSGARGVLFGTVRATSFTVVSATVVTAVVPGGVPGTVDVRVIGKKETSPATSAARWTWTGTYRADTTTEVNTTPVAVAVDSGAQLAYVVNSDNDSVSILDTRTGVFVSKVSTGFTPAGVAVDPTTHTAVATSPSQGVSIYQGTTPTTFDPVDVGAGPTAAAVDPTTHRFYLLTPGSNQVAVFDAASQTVTARIGVGTNPVAIAVDPTTHRVYVANAGSKDMTVIDGTTNTVIRTKEFGVEPTGVAVDPTTDTVYAAFGSRDLIGVTVGATGFDEQVVAVGDNPTGIAVDPTTHTVFVTNAAANSVSVVDGTTRAVVATVPVGATPSAVGVDTVGHRAVVANRAAATASLVVAADVPTVTAVSPDEASFVGGQQVTITGTDLTGATAVDFGDFPADSFTVVSATQITAVSPVGNLGEQVHVAVTTPFGTSAPTAADTFTFVRAMPTLSTTPSPGVKVTGALSTSVQLVGGSDPGGSVTFELYGPSAPTCTGDPVSRISATLSGGAASSTRNTVTVAGTYHWVVTYGGDHDNQPATTGCRDATVVTPGNLDHLVLSPASVTVAPGARQTYVVTGFDRFDNRRGDVTASSTLTIAGGTCTGATCSATTVGAHTVTATSGGKSATATLRVANPAAPRR